ncbi:MAG: hypothetical protein R3F14_31460 [Polyangiaceae bacterium]
MEAEQALDLLEDSEFGVSRRTTLDTIRVVLSDMAGDAAITAAWDHLEDEATAAAASDTSMLEVLFWRARMALRRDRPDEAASALERARPWLARSPFLLPRFERLSPGRGLGA